MINMNSYAKFLSVCAALCFAIFANNAWSEIAVPVDYAEIQVTADYAAYDTEIFNLLLNQRSLMDGKNHYSKKFSTAFDAVLSQVSLAKSKKDLAQLKRRLLSGPAPKPRFLKQGVTGKNYFYYEMCQAHACNATNLGLLYEPQLNSLSARLFIDGKYEFLGTPSDSEKSLLMALKIETGK